MDVPYKIPKDIKFLNKEQQMVPKLEVSIINFSFQLETEQLKNIFDFDKDIFSISSDGIF
jgi:hypothetical protein